MARTPWAIIKLCLPCWLIESAPYKQAFMLSLIILIPPLLISPFLLSPLLILLLLSSATMVGALSAWISVKASTMVLKHTIPLHLPPSPSSCIKLFIKTLGIHILRSFPIINSLPWAFLFAFTKNVFESKDSHKVGESPESTSTSLPSNDKAHEGRILIGEPGSVTLQSPKLDGAGHESFREVTDCSTTMGVTTPVENVERLDLGAEEKVVVGDRALRAESTDDVRMLVMGEGKGSGGKRNIMNLSRSFNDNQLHIMNGSGEGKGNGYKIFFVEISEDEEGCQDQSELDVSDNLPPSGEHSQKGDAHSRPLSDSDLRKLRRKFTSELEAPVDSTISAKVVDERYHLEPRRIHGESRHSAGCNSHSWCQKGINLEEELALLVEDIHSECLESWYPSLSTDEEFPLELKILLDTCIKRATSLGEATDIIALSLKLGSLFLCHLREFRKSRRKKRAAEALGPETMKEELSNTKIIGPLENNATREETTISGDDSHQLTPEKLDETTMECTNMEVMKENNVKDLGEGSPRPLAIHSSDSQAPSSIKPKTSNEGLTGEEAYYRLRFGSNSSKKNMHGYYLVNLAMLVVNDFICAVGKLPIDPQVKKYFRDFGSSLVESSPGNILVSMISRKVLLPLVETASDPHWLNARIASLLIEHVGARVSLEESSIEIEESMSYFPTSVSSATTVRSGKGKESLVDTCSDTVTSVEKCEELCMRSEESNSREERRKSLSLPLEVSSSNVTNPIDGRISSVLGGIISTTAGPLLPDNVGISYKPIKRMWSSPSVEEGRELDGEPEYKKKVRHFGRHIVDGLPVYSSALSGRAALAASQIVMTGDIGQQGVHSSPISKSLSEGAQKKSGPSISAKESNKKKFLGLPLSSKQPDKVTSYGGLFRSKSSHDVKTANEGNWHVEEGSELHEGAYLSDDLGSPIDGNREDKDCFSRNSARSRSFHGMNYSWQRKILCTRFAQKQNYLKKETERKGIAGDIIPDDDDIVLKFEPKWEKPYKIDSSTNSVEENDKVFDDNVIELGKGLHTQWVKYHIGKENIQGSMEEDLSQVNEADSSSSQNVWEKGDKINARIEVKSNSDGSEILDVSKRDEKPHLTKDASEPLTTEVLDPNSISLIELDVVKVADEFSQSSPLTGVEDGVMKEIVKDISPVYEEVEDLPSTVAKLKAFLKERNGSQKSEESAPSSAEGTKKEFDSLSSLELSLNQDIKPQSSPLEERPLSWPSDGGIFLNVRIPSTEIFKGTTSSQSSNPLLHTSPQVFYCIEYDAAYPEEGADAAIFGLSGDDEKGQLSTGSGSHSHGREHRKGIENSEYTETIPTSPGTVTNHMIVKRQFQDFLDLHAQLESDPLWKEALKGLKEPTRWLNLPFGKASASTVSGRRTLLQTYLRGVCTTMPQLASRSETLKTFMAYQGPSKTVTSGEALPHSVERVLPVAVEGGEGPVPRIDKFFARTVSGMFNTLKTALPGFDSQESTQQSAGSHTSASTTPLPSSLIPPHLDPSSAPATLGELKTNFGHPGTIKGTMMHLPAFLQFGNSSASTYPDLVDWDMDYSERNSGGFNSSGSLEGIPVKTLNLEEDVQAFLERLGNSPCTTKNEEFAFESLDPINESEDFRDFDDQPVSRGHGRQYLVDSADEDGEEEELDAFLPLYKMMINILCEALRGTGCWVSQGTVVHASKVIIGSFVEEKLQEFLHNAITRDMWCHYVHTLRVVLFHPPPAGLNQSCSKENKNRIILGQQLATAIFTAFPSSIRQVIGNHELFEAARFIADSLQNKVILKELVLQVLHICITHLISSGNKHL